MTERDIERGKEEAINNRYKTKYKIYVQNRNIWTRKINTQNTSTKYKYSICKKNLKIQSVCTKTPKYIQNKIKHKLVDLFQQKSGAYCSVCYCGRFSYHNNEIMSFWPKSKFKHIVFKIEKK